MVEKLTFLHNMTCESPPALPGSARFGSVRLGSGSVRFGFGSVQFGSGLVRFGSGSVRRMRRLVSLAPTFLLLGTPSWGPGILIQSLI